MPHQAVVVIAHLHSRITAVVADIIAVVAAVVEIVAAAAGINAIALLKKIRNYGNLAMLEKGSVRTPLMSNKVS